MSISNFLIGRPDQFKTLPTQNQGQTQALDQLLGNLQQQGGSEGNYQSAQNYLGQLLSRDPGVYDRFAAPYMQQFEQQTVPRLAERFAGMGGGMGGGALSSSGFGQALGGAGAQLQAQLAGLFSSLQQNAAGQATNNYQNLANLGLGQRTFENVYQPGNTGFVGQLGQGLAGGVGQAVGGAGQFTILQKLMEYLNQGNKATGTQ